jgi:propionyl-CoA carboxylase alpha chain
VLQGVRPETADIDAHLVAVVLDRVAANRRADQRWGFAPSGWRNLSTRGQRITMVESGGDAPVEYEVEYRLLGGDTWEFLLGPWPKADDDGALNPDDRPRSVVRRCGNAIEIDGRRTSPTVSRLGEAWRVSGWSGRTGWHELPRFAEHDADLAGSGPVAPLPGTVIDVRVSDGDSVEADQVLMVIEAMKMEHQITTPSAATVTAVRFSVGDRVDMGDLLVELEIGGHDS